MYAIEAELPFVLPNTLGNKSMPVHTTRWKELALSENPDDLLPYYDDYMKKYRNTRFRIIERYSRKIYKCSWEKGNYKNEN